MPRYLKISILTALALLAGLFPVRAHARETKGDFFAKKSPIEVSADYLTYDNDTDVYYARGNVIVVQDRVTMRTDEMMFSSSAGVATTLGKVEIIDEGGNVVKGENLQLDVAEKTAVIANARLFFKRENIHINGAMVKKTGEETYESDDAVFTTCDCPEGESPAWDFSVTKAKVTFGDFMTGRNAVFHIDGVPAFYFPYVTAPVKRERQTGFLTPRPGYSRLRGFILHNSFFWAISRSSDATFYLDEESSRGLGKGVEYRYYRTGKSYGEATFYQYQEKDIERVREFRAGADNLSRPESATNNRWQLTLNHTELLSAGAKVLANINLVSDDEYFIDFAKNSKDRSLESLESNVSYSKSWSIYSLTVQFRHFNNLLTSDDSATLQKLPEASFTSSDRRIFSTPFYLSSQSSYVYFYRTSGTNGHRLDLQPKISLPLNPGGYMDLVPSITPRGTFYYTSVSGADDRAYDRYMYNASVDMTTTFVRVYHMEGGSLAALKHTFRPKLTYTYIPSVNQSDLPSFDTVDNVSSASTFTYSINNTLTGKGMYNGRKAYRNYLYMDLSQSYNIKEAMRDLTSPTDKRKPFSDVTLDATVKPSDSASIVAKASYDTYNRWFTSYDTSLTAKDRRGDDFSIAHRFTRGTSHYLEASLRGKMTPAIDATLLERYSYGDHKPLETSYGLEYKHQCFTSLLTYTVRPEEKVVYLTFTLKGLGRVAGIQGRLDSL